MFCPITLSIESHLSYQDALDAEQEAEEVDPLEGYDPGEGLGLEEWENREEAHEVTVMEIA